MRTLVGMLTILTLCAALRHCGAQGLSPRAYVITPVRSNAVTLTYQLQAGDVVFSSIPVQNSHGRIGTEICTYFHTMNLFGRSANLNVSLPYGVGHFNGEVVGVEQKLYRSGLAPLTGRLSVNLIGAPAMVPSEFVKWSQKTLLGASLTVVTPTGQYDPARLINVGDNRWEFKPEVGFSRLFKKKWIFDAYGAVWFFTANDNFFRNAPGTNPPNKQTQEPMGAVEMHLSYDVKPRCWVSVDGNYWYGGATSLNGKQTPTTLQANSRIGATAAIPINKHQAVKFSYSAGTYVTFGGNFQNVSVAWQYSWLGRPN
jgi:Putative MetA-pathway of phenol degradation